MYIIFVLLCPKTYINVIGSESVNINRSGTTVKYTKYNIRCAILIL